MANQWLFCDLENFLACNGMVGETDWPGLQDEVSFRAIRLWCRERGADINYLKDHLIVVRKVPAADLPFMPLDRVVEQLATAPETTAPTKTALVEQPANPNDERDKYIYDSYLSGAKLDVIRSKVKNTKGWGKLESRTAVINAGNRYAVRKSLPPLPRRNKSKQK